MNDFLYSIAQEPLKVIDNNISLEKYVPISISSENKTLTSFDVSSALAWEAYIDKYLQSKNEATVAYGGYLEKRDIYKRSTYFNKEAGDDERNIHLGIDLWCAEQTNVLAVLDGEIHSFGNNKNYGDYGPTIIIKHEVGNFVFFSLYGHLSLESIKNKKVGQKVKKEEIIGTLGDHTINGDYAPHLHFQLIKDMGEYIGDYPGVCSKNDVNYFKVNCPNPNLLLKLPF
ncbi:peptidoglycan DD-metalloendopeptidase family protein [Tenacibaculum amylolyticum]|uniref:peptidoglycan DD-metalloendopeptidase family protein n=1 Tax=Tenacibaculum amylolyticum TaxID=104269 RepID=UPI0038947656